MGTHPYQDCIVAYVDILGWSSLLMQSSDDTKRGLVERAVGCLEFLSKKSAERRIEFARRRFNEASNTRFSYFSDSIVLSCPTSQNESGWMVWEVQLLCDSLLQAGQYVRGAIVRGELFHSETMLFGPALVEAHEIERDVAKYPRIVVTGEAAPFVVVPGDPTDPAKRDEPRDPQWSTDTDGLRFLELFPRKPDGKRLQQYQDEARKARVLVRNDLETATTIKPNLNHQAKYGWLLRYLDGVVTAETSRS